VRLVFHGGGHSEDNIKLNREALRMCREKDPVIAYIPACSIDAESDFLEFARGFQELGVGRFLYFPIDVPFDQTMLTQVFSANIIHLSGGNTFYFLKWLRRTKLMTKIKEFVRNGGVLTGLSAGGILMTPDISSASYPEFDCDENEEHLRDLRALKLVNFEFFPHYRNSKRYERELINQSKLIDYPIYGVADGNGIVVEGEKTSFVGKTLCFYKGKKIIIGR
tara:strand:+ start:26782 stop:27447 length:666 start_codon:yes stop_codon:yes gene_type:complete